MFKVRKALLLTTAILLIMLAMTACGRKGETNPNVGPTIRITSYEGVVDSSGVDTEDPALFQQRIYWEANDADGVVDSYAYRVVDENGNPYPNGTPGHEVIDEEGWIYHYNSGADESIPLEETEQKSIWTDQVYSVINFPANVDGDSAVVVSRFDVKCKDNDGNESIAIDVNGNAVEPSSAYASKYFSAYSNNPEVFISSTKGDINGKEIGRGIVFQFTIDDNTPFVGSVPDYYTFRLEKRDLLGRVIPESEGGYPDLEYNTKKLSNVSRYLVTEFTEPSLKLNTYASGVPQDSTYIIAKAVNLSGVESEPKEVGFAVKEGFYPDTIIFNGSTNPVANAIYALGDNHFTTYIAEQIPTIIPSTVTNEGTHFSTPFWIDKDGSYSLIGSNNLNIYMKWGYRGQFESNNPNNKMEGAVQDELTGAEYFSEIRYYDLRLDGEAFIYSPLPPADHNVVDAETGKEWLRVPISATIAEKVTLTGLSSGTHKFEVRAVDLQGVPDQTPSEMIFKIVEPTPRAEKSGILIIDDDENDNLTAPAALIDSLYSSFVEDYAGEVDVLHRAQMPTANFDLHFSTNVFSPTDLQKYKLVIYHSDTPKRSNKFAYEYDTMNLYLRGGGNMVLSGCSTLKTIVMEDARSNGFPLITRFFGVPVTEEDALLVPIREDGTSAAQDAFLKLSYFVKAHKAESMQTDIELELPSFNPNVNVHPLAQVEINAYGPLSYFNEDLLLPGTEVIYRFGSKEPGDGLFDPTLDEYVKYSEQPVAIRRVTNNNSCYMFGFPLSYMKPDQVKTTLNQIIEELEAADQQ